MCQEINRATNHQELKKIAVYYFDGQGKAIRPMVAMLMAKALNYHMHNETSNVVHAQRQIAMISEMIHTASLVHDDVIDQSFARRGKPSVNVIWNHKKKFNLSANPSKGLINGPPGFIVFQGFSRNFPGNLQWVTRFVQEVMSDTA
ncbi:hypothetical protein RP20_CCG022134 [Aedes albopictus]|nr:hypothetical protein RP20_CCG022134 [Aedes albopictus]